MAFSYFEWSALPQETQLFFLESRSQLRIDVISRFRRDSPNARLVVIDLSHLEYPIQPPWRVPSRFGNGKQGVHRIFEALGVEYLEGRLFNSSILKLSAEESEALNIAIESSLITTLRKGRGDMNPLGLIQKVIRKIIASRSEKCFAVSLSAIEELSPSRVFISNGRFANEQASLLAARRVGVSTLFLERKGTFGHLFARDYRIHDRLTSQRHALEVSKSLQKSAMAESADRWLEMRRQKNSTQNVFSSLWSESGDAWKGPTERLALFVTSSSDEYQSLDLDWDEAIWEDQLSAFKHVWDRIASRGLRPVLRVHPNLLNKHPVAGYREILAIRKFASANPAFIIVWPASAVSTYQLLAYSALVVVNNSTVGLEASLMAIPVICTNSCGYDLVADVITAHSPSDLEKLDHMSFSADKSKAQRYLGVQDELDMRISPNEFGIDILISSKWKILIPGILSGAVFSILFEMRWKAFRALNLLIFPK
jgi:hypothetical protein